MTEVRTGAGRAAALTADGEHPAELALVADGLHSTLRARLSDDAPVCSGYVAYRGAFPLDRLSQRLDPRDLHNVVVYIGPGCHLVQYPLRRGEVLNTVAVFASPAYARGEDDWGGPDELDAAFAHACLRVRECLASLWRDRRWPMYDRLPISRWVDGRLALTGDAAHPMLQYLAQGACQAIEDAAELASSVAHHATGTRTDWASALADYEAVRTRRTAEVQARARIWGDIWHVDGLARGRLRIIGDLDDFARFALGDVLVCRATSPAWTPLLTRAAAVVTTHGGVLAHAAIVARELRIPAVTDVTSALNLPDGALVDVDGTAGTITAQQTR